MNSYPTITWTRMLALSLLAVLTLGLSPASAHPHRRWNPPGRAGGPGTNWLNPPGPRGGPGATPYRLHRRGFRGNPPGPAGGPGTNWANPPGPVGGPGASPFRVRPHRRWRSLAAGSVTEARSSEVTDPVRRA